MGLTMLRLLLLPVFLWLILASANGGAQATVDRWSALAIFAAMALTDKLDGYLARKLNQTSRIGALLDPVADKLLVACSVILLSFDWVASARLRIPLPVVATIYLGYLFVTGGAIVVLAVIGQVSIQPRLAGKVNTFLQLLLVLLTLLAVNLPREKADPLRHVLVFLWWAVPVVAVITCADYGWHGIQLLRQHFRDRSKTSSPKSP